MKTMLLLLRRKSSSMTISSPVSHTVCFDLLQALCILTCLPLESLTGIEIVVHLYCSLHLWNQRKQRKSSPYLLIYMTLSFATQTVFCAIQARVIQISFVDNRDYPGGPLAYLMVEQAQLNLVMCIALFATTFLTDLLVVSNMLSIHREYISE